MKTKMIQNNSKQHRRHPRNRLSVLDVQNAQSRDRTRRIGDGGGLYLVIQASGAKSWVLRTVVKGKRCDIGLGSASLVSLAEAREAARRLRRIARMGGDPLAERQREVYRFTERHLRASFVEDIKSLLRAKGGNADRLEYALADSEEGFFVQFDLNSMDDEPSGAGTQTAPICDH